MINCQAESEPNMNKEDLRAKLLADAEAAIDALLDKAATDKPMRMRDIVALAQGSGRQIETAIVATFSQAAGEQESAAPVCGGCGRVMHYKGRRKRDIVTEAGETRLERAYYYCPGCKVGHFPPG